MKINQSLGSKNNSRAQRRERELESRERQGGAIEFLVLVTAGQHHTERDGTVNWITPPAFDDGG